MRWLALASLVACSDGSGSPDAADLPRQMVRETRTLVVGDLQEAILEGGAGDVAVITLSAPQAALDWNLHGHPAGMGTVTVHEELAVMTAQFRFAPAMATEWFLLLRNKHTDTMSVQVAIDLFGDMQWRGF